MPKHTYIFSSQFHIWRHMPEVHMKTKHQLRSIYYLLSKFYNTLEIFYSNTYAYDEETNSLNKDIFEK